jgi:hypothetical protein
MPTENNMLRKNPSLKEEADELMKVKGNTKGSEFLTLKKYVEIKYGIEKVRELEEKMAELGYPLHFDKIQPTYWYPQPLFFLATIVAKEILDWPDLFEFGYNSPPLSFGAKVFIKYLPLPLYIKTAPRVWRSFISFGDMEIPEFDEKERYVVVRIKNYKIHPASCRYYEGFFLKLAEHLIRSEKVTIEETECPHRGGSYHQFTVRWI